MDFDRDIYLNESLPIKFELLNLFNIEDSLNIFEIGSCEGEDSIRY